MAFDPQALQYTKEHEWIKIDGDVAIVGITEYAAEQLGDVVHVELPGVGSDYEPGDSFGEVESVVKSVSDLYLPVHGKVIEVNAILADNAGLVNEDPYGEGWMVKVALSSKDGLDALLTSDQYQAFLSEEA